LVSDDSVALVKTLTATAEKLRKVMGGWKQSAFPILSEEFRHLFLPQRLFSEQLEGIVQLPCVLHLRPEPPAGDRRTEAAAWDD